MSLKIKVSAEEILAGKFRNTIQRLNGYVTEARGDVSIGQTYSANAVHSRMLNIKEAFDRDLRDLAADLDLSGDDVGDIGKKLDQINNTLTDGVTVKTGGGISGPRP